MLKFSAISITSFVAASKTKKKTTRTLFSRFSIILEAAYSLYDKAFFDNLSTILVMAVIVSVTSDFFPSRVSLFIFSSRLYPNEPTDERKGGKGALY